MFPGRHTLWQAVTNRFPRPATAAGSAQFRGTVSISDWMYRLRDKVIGIKGCEYIESTAVDTDIHILNSRNASLPTQTDSDFRLRLCDWDGFRANFLARTRRHYPRRQPMKARAGSPQRANEREGGIRRGGPVPASASGTQDWPRINSRRDVTAGGGAFLGRQSRTAERAGARRRLRSQTTNNRTGSATDTRNPTW